MGVREIMKRELYLQAKALSFGCRVRSGAAMVATAVLCAAAVGCSAAAEEGNASDGETASTTSALRCTSDPNNGDCPWKGTWAKLTPRNGVDIQHNWAPALISSDAGWVTFSVDQTNHFRMLQWHANGRGPAWDTYGSPRTWNSRPAAAMKDDFSAGRAGFVIAGKARTSDSNNNKLMASTGVMGVSGGPTTLGNPVPDRPFAVVDNNNVYNTNGLPGMGSFVNGSNGAVLIVVMGDDGRTIYGYNHNLPYNSNGWSGRITGPALPTGWKVVYAPTVARLPVTYRIAIHAHNNNTGADAMFWTDFYSNGTDQAYFSNEISSPISAWSSPVNVGAINDDPWLTFSPTFGLTAYFRRGSQIMENAFPSVPTTLPALPVNPSAGIQFASSPAATGDRGFDMGTQVVVARSTSNQIYYHDTNNDGILEP